ncbi:MAG: hypothetical protein AAF709_12260, partial [Pseudomonadota bacterium]
MTILELSAEDLLQLTELQLEELVARLAQSELSILNGRSFGVQWSGSVNAPDGGIDVKVDYNSESFRGDFVPRAQTVFQVKRPNMGPAKITTEMRPNDELLPIFDDLAQVSGAYIIVSLKDRLETPQYKKRVETMKLAVSNCANSHALHLDFFDRARLQSWVREHPGVQLWLRHILGKPLLSWLPHGRWSMTPDETDDSFICDEGLEIVVPGKSNTPVSLNEGLPLIRELVLESPKAVRIAGLSGVGKTRLVQALFEEVDGLEPLEATQAIYADVGDAPTPSAIEMLEILQALGRRAYLVLDNCPAELHNRLAARVRRNETTVRLITVEYDIKEDTNQATEVVKIEACGTEIAEQLVRRRFPALGELNARKIAEFSEGNARLALALADTVPANFSLAKLTDRELFDRLFRQRNPESVDLKSAAEALALVYSFSVSNEEAGTDELALLGKVCDLDRAAMHRHAAELLRRQIAQQRGRWRALLPHAVANRLASEALENVPLEYVLNLFEGKASPRMLRSFSKRLGYLHDHPVAHEIVERWMAPEGLLSSFSSLNELGTAMFNNVAPVAPKAVLKLLERAFSEGGVSQFGDKYSSVRSTLLGLLTSLAYEHEAFESAVDMLAKLAEVEDPDNNYNSVRDRLYGLFALYLSGSHATPELRARIARENLFSGNDVRRDIGLGMLRSALKSGRWTSLHSHEFGARPRDYGYRPSYNQAIEWFDLFLNLLLEAARSDDTELRSLSRKLLSEKFRGIWRYEGMRTRLLDVGRELNSDGHWFEGWASAKSVLAWDDRADTDRRMDAKARAKLEGFAAELEPRNLIQRVRSLVVGEGHREWVLEQTTNEGVDSFSQAYGKLHELAFELGTWCANDLEVIEELAPELFSEHNQFRWSFGRGVFQATSDPEALWADAVKWLKATKLKQFEHGFLFGAMISIKEREPELAFRLLEQCTSDQILLPYVVALLPFEPLSSREFKLLLQTIESTNVLVGQFEVLIWRDDYGLSNEQHAQIASALIKKPNGALAVVHALSMRLHADKNSGSSIGTDLRAAGLRAAIEVIAEHGRGLSDRHDYDLNNVLKHLLPFKEFEWADSELVAVVFKVADQSYGHMPHCEGAVQQIAKWAPEEFLERGVANSDKDRRFMYFRSSIRGTHPLDEVSAETLLGWCQSKDNPEMWERVAKAIFPFKIESDESSAELTAQAVALICNAPSPEKIAQAYIERL